jgi:penicillin-binding protein 2
VALRAAGKTGTADVVIGGRKLNNASFVGYAPFDDPRYCAVVSYEGVPQETYGGGLAGEPVAALLRMALAESAPASTER